jgi:hypothetical protein
MRMNITGKPLKKEKSVQIVGKIHVIHDALMQNKYG